MAVAVLTSASVYIDTLDASAYVSELSSPLTVDMSDAATTLASGGYIINTPTMRHGEISFSGVQDWASGGFFETINQSDIGISGGNHLVTVVPGTSTAALDPCCFMNGPIDAITQGDGAVGDIAKMAVHVSQSTPMCFGVLGHPSATRTTTGTGTVIAWPGPTATQAWYAGLHVFSGSGGNLIVTVKSDDAVGFPSATTRITFTTATGPTYEQKSVAGSFSSETHARVDWSVSAGTFTFAVVLATISLV